VFEILLLPALLVAKDVRGPRRKRAQAAARVAEGPKDEEYWASTMLLEQPAVGPSAQGFDYDVAFSRNIGWVTAGEQALLRSKRVAIAGMGGVGGVHLLTLARLGIEKFNIADLDVFEVANFNRQVGASLPNVGKSKVEVLAQMARDINPRCRLELFAQGVNDENLAAFMKDVDIYIDGLDFFAFEVRERVFAYCAAHRIPAVTVAPLGMSAALLNFVPGGMSFEDYFQLAGHEELDKAVRFLVGLAPGLLHRHYLADKGRVDLRARKGPSTIMACQLCAGVAASEALKILLGRGKVLAAPHGVQFDGYQNRMAHTWRPGGNRNPINRLAIAIARRQLGL
jgi:molybdopterin/thiamine biosynthesis adenylyltransferase